MGKGRQDPGFPGSKAEPGPYPSRLRRWVEQFAEIFFPFSCHVCSRPSPFGKVLCFECLARLGEEIGELRQIRDVITPFPIFTLANYDGALARTIKAIKYRPSTKLFQALAPLLKKVSWPEKEGKPEVLVPVPLHSEREKKRGFNQAELLARCFATSWGIPVCPALVRPRPTTPQAEKTAEDRHRNLVGAFALAPGLQKSVLKNLRLCLIDDVGTTGSTIDACLTTLKLVAPRSLQAMVLAHSPKMI